jgi:hypothetical protein
VLFLYRRQKRELDFYFNNILPEFFLNQLRSNIRVLDFYHFHKFFVVCKTSGIPTVQCTQINMEDK